LPDQRAILPRSLLAVVNPRAGRPADLQRLHSALRTLEQHGWSVDIRGTLWPQHARQMAETAVRQGCEAVLAVGGDGTINEVVNGLAGSATALAVLPAGTVNVWAREAYLPFAADAAVRLLETGQRARIDLGRAGGRYFLLLASAGVDSVAVRAVSSAARRWKRESYVLSGLRDLFRHGGRPMSFTVGDDESPETLSARTLLAVCGNTRLYGGVVRLTARARLDDGLLDLCVLTGRGPTALVGHALRAFPGRHLTSAAIVYRQARRIRINAESPLPVQLDGEHAGSTPVVFSAVPRALTVVLPPDLRSPLFGNLLAHPA
jgi:diacylglycerol kinase (ATP)